MGNLIVAFRKAINPPYKPADLVTLFVTILILLALPLITIESTNSQNLETRAGENAISNCPLTIGDKVEPTVAIENPQEGNRVIGRSLLIKIRATDNICVQKVLLLIDGTSVKTFAKAPYDYSWDLQSVEAGNHTISAQVLDSAGNFSMASVSVFRGVKNNLLP